MRKHQQTLGLGKRANKLGSLFLVLTLLSFGAYFGVRQAQAAWTEPTGSPPGGNVAAPLNVSNTPQEKSGNLTIHGIFSTTGTINASTSGSNVYSIQATGNNISGSMTLATGVLGFGGLATTANTAASGVYGVSYQGTPGVGLHVGLLGVAGFDSGNSVGIYGSDGGHSSLAYAGYFKGRVGVEGDLCLNGDCRSTWSGGGSGESLFTEDPTDNTYLTNTHSNLAIGGTSSDNADFFFDISASPGTFYAGNEVIIGPPIGGNTIGDHICSPGETCASSDCTGQPDSCPTGQICDPYGSNRCVVPGGADTTPPSVPQNLHVDGGTVYPTSVPLAWDASTDNPGGIGMAGYKVYKCQGQNCAPTTLIRTLDVITSMVDTDVLPNTYYSYAVSAFDGASPPNESAASTRLQVLTPNSPGGGSPIMDKTPGGGTGGGGNTNGGLPLQQTPNKTIGRSSYTEPAEQPVIGGSSPLSRLLSIPMAQAKIRLFTIPEAQAAGGFGGNPNIRLAINDGVLQIKDATTGNILELGNAGTDIASTSNIIVRPGTATGAQGASFTKDGTATDLILTGALRLGNNNGSTPGTIRYTGSDFQGYVNGAWKSLTGGGGLAADQVIWNSQNPPGDVPQSAASIKIDGSIIAGGDLYAGATYVAGNVTKANLLVNSSGNVGIGLTGLTVASKLDVNGNVMLNQYLDFGSNGGNGGGDWNTEYALRFWSGGQVMSQIMRPLATRDLAFYTDYNDGSHEGTYDDVERMRILSNGNVGINQTAPVGKFVVNNNVAGVGSAGDAVSIYANTVNSALYAQQNNTNGYAGYFSGDVVLLGDTFAVNLNVSGDARVGRFYINGQQKDSVINVYPHGSNAPRGKYLYTTGTTKDQTATGIKFWYDDGNPTQPVQWVWAYQVTNTCPTGYTEVTANINGTSYFESSGSCTVGTYGYVTVGGTPYSPSNTQVCRSNTVDMDVQWVFYTKANNVNCRYGRLGQYIWYDYFPKPNTLNMINELR